MKSRGQKKNTEEAGVEGSNLPAPLYRVTIVFRVPDIVLMVHPLPHNEVGFTFNVQ